MFGKKKDQTLADEEAVKAELQRLQSLPIEQVAAEVMTRTFGPSGPIADGEIRPMRSPTDSCLNRYAKRSTGSKITPSRGADSRSTAS